MNAESTPLSHLPSNKHAVHQILRNPCHRGHRHECQSLCTVRSSTQKPSLLMPISQSIFIFSRLLRNHMLWLLPPMMCLLYAFFVTSRHPELISMASASRIKLSLLRSGQISVTSANWIQPSSLRSGRMLTKVASDKTSLLLAFHWLVWISKIHSKITSRPCLSKTE